MKIFRSVCKTCPLYGFMASAEKSQKIKTVPFKDSMHIWLCTCETTHDGMKKKTFYGEPNPLISIYEDSNS